MRRELAGAYVAIPFTTHSSSGTSRVGPSANFVAADFMVMRVRSTGEVSYKVTTNGISVTTDVNGKTGCHVLTINTGNDTGDSGFWTVPEAEFFVLLYPATTTVDGKPVNVWLAEGKFSLSPSYAIAQTVGYEAITDTSFSEAALEALRVALLRHAMVESYAGLGAAPTLEQALYCLMSHHNEATVGETTKITKKLDGVTTAMTFTLTNDVSGNPIAVTRV